MDMEAFRNFAYQNLIFLGFDDFHRIAAFGMFMGIGYTIANQNGFFIARNLHRFVASFFVDVAFLDIFADQRGLLAGFGHDGLITAFTVHMRLLRCFTKQIAVFLSLHKLDLIAGIAVSMSLFRKTADAFPNAAGFTVTVLQHAAAGVARQGQSRLPQRKKYIQRNDDGEQQRQSRYAALPGFNPHQIFQAHSQTGAHNSPLLSLLYQIIK